MSITPIELNRTAVGLQILWSDDQSTEFTIRQLRDACPCATCREKRQGDDEYASETPPRSMTLPVLSAAEARPLEVTHMHPVGNYAYNIGFSDGHDSGIFTFDFLRDLV